MKSALQTLSSPAVTRLIIAVVVLLANALILLPKDAYAFQTPTLKQQRYYNAAHHGNTKVINNNNNNNSDNRLSSSTTSITSLYFFGKKQNDEGQEDGDSTKDMDSISNNNDNDSDNSNIFTRAWPTLKIALPSFLVGGIATLCVLFLPLVADYYDAFNGQTGGNFYNTDSTSTSKTASSGGGGSGSSKSNMNNVNQPVILFETILNDLNDAYVDDVDIQKLFETGVKAMTASLDPYTEFESRTEAAELEETVTGRYGGVGLVIRGGTNLADASDDIVLEQVDNTQSSSSSSSDGNNKKQPKNASKPPVAVNGADEDEEDLDIIERKRARRKSMEEGVRVVSAFEGYAYDAGMRVGDKLLAVDDFEIKPTTAVDEVRNHLRGEPGTEVQIKFLREGVGGKMSEPQTITLKRAVVHIPDVKYFGFVGDPTDGIGYIDLTGEWLILQCSPMQSLSFLDSYFPMKLRHMVTLF
jgi:hypothetical protein